MSEHYRRSEREEGRDAARFSVCAGAAWAGPGAAQVWPASDCGGATREERDANARLIAAAPDLLAALREAQRSLAAVAGLLATYPRPSNDPHGRTLLDSMEHAKAASHAARAAVAKAGGA